MIICIDTSTPTLMVALVEKENLVWIETKRSKSQGLFSLLPEIKKLEKITSVIVGLGPGSFTGMRVGITFAKTFALAKKIPCFGVPSLHAIKNEQSMKVLARSRKNELYLFDPSQNILQVISEDQKPAKYIGPLLQEENEYEKFDRNLYLPDPLTMVNLTEKKSQLNEIRPIYMRASYAEEKACLQSPNRDK